MERVNLDTATKGLLIGLGFVAASTLGFALKKIYDQVPLTELKSLEGLKKQQVTLLQAAAGLTGLIGSVIAFDKLNKHLREEKYNRAIFSTNQESKEIAEQENKEGIAKYKEAMKTTNNKKRVGLLQEAVSAFQKVISLKHKPDTSSLGSAYLELSIRFYKGEGVEKNAKKSFDCLFEASMYSKDALETLVENHSESVTRRATELKSKAKEKNADAMLQTAINYLQETGVKENEATAKAWLDKHMTATGHDVEAVITYIESGEVPLLGKKEALISKIKALYAEE